jgi:hypothetical protein
MKKSILVTVALVASLYSATAQQAKTELTAPLSAIHVVALKLSGSNIIRTTTHDSLQMSSFLLTNGKVWGWKFPAERPDFKITRKESRDTLYITAPEKYQPNTIGISTYSESIENSLEIPSGKKIVILNPEKVKVTYR